MSEPYWHGGSGARQTKKGPGDDSPGPFVTMSRRRPTLPPRYQGSTIGAGGLNFRVRNGTGCSPSAVAAETAWGCEPPSVMLGTSEPDSEREQESSPRPISTGRLNTSPCLHLRPIYLVVCEGPYPVDPVGDLILGRASRLDAFSAYPCRTWPTSSAAGATTGTPEVRPPRSSRTGGSSPQVSCARGG
jgi:hypothetical protein